MFQVKVQKQLMTFSVVGLQFIDLKQPQLIFKVHSKKSKISKFIKVEIIRFYLLIYVVPYSVRILNFRKSDPVYFMVNFALQVDS